MEFINYENGWAYALFFFISGNFFLSLLSIFKNIKLRLIMCILTVIKIYFAIFESLVIIVMPYWYDKFGIEYTLFVTAIIINFIFWFIFEIYIILSFLQNV